MSPTEGVKVYSRLAREDKVSAVYGSLISNIGLAVSPVAEQIKIPVVSRALDERVTTPDFKMEDPENPGRVNPYCFLLQPSSYQQSYMIAGFAIDELKLNTFAQLFTPSNSYSLMLAKGFEYYVKKRGKKMLGDFEFQAGDADFKAQLTKVKALGPDGFYIPNYVPGECQRGQAGPGAGNQDDHARKQLLVRAHGQGGRLGRRRRLLSSSTSPGMIPPSNPSSTSTTRSTANCRGSIPSPDGMTWASSSRPSSGPSRPIRR